jgi:hypothetical protein
MALTAATAPHGPLSNSRNWLFSREMNCDPKVWLLSHSSYRLDSVLALGKLDDFEDCVV